MASNDEVVAMQLHKELNAISLRTRRGHGPELGQQLSFDRLKRDRGTKIRSKRTNSSSQDHPSGKKQRTSDADEHGHTSARHRPIKRDPEDSNNSHGGSEQQHQRKHADGRHSVSRDSERALLLRDPDPMQLLQSCSQPIEAAAMYAAHKAKQQAMQQHAQQPSQDTVKVFFAGVRWALSLPRSAVKSRQQLAKALNDAFVGEILSVGQGEGLAVVFVDAHGSTAAVEPTKWSSSSRSQSTRWKTLVKSAARIYVSAVQ